MTGLAIKSLWARKARALATTFAVVIGVAFVAGSYVLTDTIFAAFDEIFSESLKGTSVVVTAENPVKQENGEVPTIPRLAAAAGEAHARGAPRLRRDLHPGRLLRRRRQEDRQQIRPQVHLLDAARPRSSRSPTSKGTGRAGRTKPRSTGRPPKRPA